MSTARAALAATGLTFAVALVATLAWPVRDASAQARMPAPAKPPAEPAAPPPVPARADSGTTEPPLNVTADNMTGSHGPDGDEVLLNGNLHVTRGRSLLTADFGRYLRQKGMLYLDGHVKMVDSTTTVTCDHASYSEPDDVLLLNGNVVLVDKDATLKAPRGRYDRRTGRAEFEGGIEGRDRLQRLTADHAVYVRDSSLVHTRGHCHGYDDENHFELEANAIDYNRTTFEAVATGEPLLRSREDGGRMTLIRARQLRLNTETRIAEAIDSVTVERDTLRGRADYGRFDDRAQHGILLGSPRVWDDQTTMSGDTLELYSEKRALRRVAVLGNAVMDYQGNRTATIGEASKLTGRRADIWFTKDAIDSLVAIGEARDLYVAPARAGKTTERNEAAGDTITVFFKSRKIDRAQVRGGAHGEYRLPVDVADTTAAKREFVTYEGKRILFVVPQSKIVLDGEASLSYTDLKLTAKRVEYDVDAQTLVAEGHPELVEKGESVEGHLMTYDMSTRVGTIYNADTEYERALYHGERIRKANDQELDVMNGSYSTCNLDPPHYHFTARWMKIYLKDKLVAKPVVFYVKNVPLLALPFWIFPIKPGRHSGFLFPQFEFGFNTAAGQFIRNAGYYWAPNDYLGLTASGDYYQAEPSWVMRAQGEYKLLYVLDGDFNGTYARNERLKSEDYDFTADHLQDLTPRTRLSARASFVSSRDYSTSDLYGRTLNQRLNRFLTSSLAITHNADWASFSAVMDRRQDLDADDAISDPLNPSLTGTQAPLANLTQNLPSLTLSFPTRTLGSLPLLRDSPFGKSLKSTYFSMSSRFQQLEERRGVVAGYIPFTVDSVLDSTAVIAQQVTTRSGFGTDASLSDSRRVGGFLNLSPHVDGHLVVFDYDVLGNKVVPAGTWNAGVTSNASFYGTFRTHLGPLIGLRHIVTPSVAYAYSPQATSLTYTDQFGVTHERFTSFGSIGISGFEQSSLALGLDQRLQAKVQSGDKITRLDNLVSLTTRSNYNFLWREQGQLHPFSPPVWGLAIQPPGVFSASASWLTDFYEGRPLRNLSYNLGAVFSANQFYRRSATPELPVGQPVSQTLEEATRSDWSVALAYSYAGGYSGLPTWVSTQTANAVARLQVSRNWGLEYSTSADLVERRLQTQRFSITRELHCWQASFTRTFIQGGEAEYYFRLSVKDQRELYYERGTRAGSLGGIQ